MSDYYPLLAVDLWEHAYYGDHRDGREQYLSSTLSRINWKFVETNYAVLEMNPKL